MVARPPPAVLQVAGAAVRVAGALLGLGAWLNAGCCVGPPRAGDLLAVGFRSPEQAFATFQTAVRADDPTWQRRCLSSDFIARNGLSELAFRESWQRMEQAEPFLRKGIADARPKGAAEVRGARARLSAESHGRRVEIDFVCEDFCEAYAGSDRVVDEAAPFAERTGVQEGADGARWIYGRMPLAPGTDPHAITEIRVGREWKIDGFEVLGAREAAARTSPAHAAPPDRDAQDDLP